MQQSNNTQVEVNTIRRGLVLSLSQRAQVQQYRSELDTHHGWGVCFIGYVNAAGYGYVYEPTMAVTQDGWDAHRAFLVLPERVRLAVVLESLLSGKDIDWESARKYLKHEWGIIIHNNSPF